MPSPASTRPMGVPPEALLHYQRPHRMDDPLRSLWYRIHHDHDYAPSNIEARFLGERLTEYENERNRFEGVLRFILQTAESWHGDDEAKGRALAVIAATVKDVLPDA